MKECAICGEKLDKHAIRCSQGHSLFRSPRGSKTYRRLVSKLQFCLGCCSGQILLFGLILLFGIAGLGIWYTEPAAILTCRYVETKQVDCQLQNRMLWLIPVREIPITHLKKAYVKEETATWKDELGQEKTASVYRVMLLGGSGEELEFGYFDKNRAASERTAKQINDFFNVPTDETLTVWYTPWGMILSGGCLFSVFVFLLYFLWIRNMMATAEPLKNNFVFLAAFSQGKARNYFRTATAPVVNLYQKFSRIDWGKPFRGRK